MCTTKPGQEHVLVTAGDLCLCADEEFAESFGMLTRAGGICDLPCAGDASQNCGGSEAYDAYVAQSEKTGVGE